jgi:hypothetical protein
MASPPQSTGFYYFNCIWFIVKLFQFSTVSLPPLSSLAYRTIYSAKDFPFENTQSSFIIFCRSPGFCSACKYWPHKCFICSGVCYNERCYNEQFLWIKSGCCNERSQTGIHSSKKGGQTPSNWWASHRTVTQDEEERWLPSLHLYVIFIRESLFIVFTKERLFMLFKFTCTVYKS